MSQENQISNLPVPSVGGLSVYLAQIKKFPRGYGQLFSQHVQQAHEGCDFDFLSGNAAVDEPEIH